MQQGVGQRAMMMNGGQQIQYTNQAQFGVQQVQYVNPGQQVQMVALQPGQQIQMANHGQPVVLRPPHAQPAIMQTRPPARVHPPVQINSPCPRPARRLRNHPPRKGQQLSPWPSRVDTLPRNLS